MRILFYEDPDTGLPHIYGHGVTEEEVRQVLGSRGEDLPGTRDSRMKTAYELRGKAKTAFRRRQRRKPR
jgi:hypothetical protein